MNERGTIYYQDVQKCVDEIIEKIGHNIVLGLPLGLGKANNLANEFFRRAKNDPDIKLKILTALSLEKPSWSSDLEQRFLEPFVERVFGDYANLSYINALRKNELPSNVEIVEFFYKPGGFLTTRHVQQNYLSANFTHACRDIINNGCNVAAQMIAKKTFGDRTMYSLSCNPDVTIDVGLALKEQEKTGKKIAVIGEVNQNLPFMYGDAMVEPSIFHAIVDSPNYYNKLFGAPKMALTTQDFMIGLYASTLVKDGGTLQIGIGSLGDALVYGLQQRQLENDLYNSMLEKSGINDKFGKDMEQIGGTKPFEEGIYGSTEMLVDGYLQLIKCGVIKRQVYDDVNIQRLINEGKLNHEITPKTIEILIEQGAINAELTRWDLKYLQKFGIVDEKWNYEVQNIVCGDMIISADLTKENNFSQFTSNCLCKTLKNGILIHAGFFLGPQAFYAELNNMSEEERKQIFMTSVTHVNQLYGSQFGNERLKIMQRKEARFINAALMLTLLGAVVSDGLEDGTVVSGVGGQYNFVSQAHALPGGRSILMAKSVRTKGKDVSSNIVWNYGHITIPRHLRDIVITEYGFANIRSKTDKDIIAAILNITDSRFQESLLQGAKRARKIPDSYQIPDKFKNNTPARLEADLAPFKEKGMFPPFPFGMDFTEEELVIGKALRGLKEKMAEGISSKAKSLTKAMTFRSVPENAKPYLERLELDNPVSSKEKMMQKLVLFALDSSGAI